MTRLPHDPGGQGGLQRADLQLDHGLGAGVEYPGRVEVSVWCSCDMLASGDTDILHRPVEAAQWLSAALHR